MVCPNRGCEMHIKPRSPCRINPKHPQDFHVVDDSSFPFHELNDRTLCTELVGHFIGPFYRGTRGNHIAGYILAKHRIRANESSLRWTNLEAVFDLPQELFLQILEYLHPIDLYHIIRTTKPLRSLLLSKSALKIWERSFLAYPDIPFYPNDVSAPKWASLLFAKGFCNVSPSLTSYGFSALIDV
ncbi:hypothetical protein HYPSUDRAFT_1028577 [Hypholoma sublateritium FD-334 SS-4]|uniref:F-box domain-containing protein n=1 Tax=Hypholoma sublateritium (strain FD-334 SS-4) TaxID=945553 RepID=A0A0D2Q5C3_HYPSF|nr:hypothetical protein HYPSUDRAFT_1028577 [Hypholoma sublateritium FD-334 SS-4]